MRNCRRFSFFPSHVDPHSSRAVGGDVLCGELAMDIILITFSVRFFYVLYTLGTNVVWHSVNQHLKLRLNGVLVPIMAVQYSM